MPRHIKTAALAAQREEADAKIRSTVESIIADVAKRRDAAVRELSERFDKWSPPSFRLSDGEIRGLIAKVAPPTIDDIKFAQAQIRNFAEIQRASLTDVEVETLPGVVLGALDILVNNAGLNRPQPFLDVNEETLDRLLTVNVRAAFLVAQAAARLMVPQGSGVIINMSSQMGHVGSERDRTVYVMTKHAIEGLTKAMAVELAPKGVRVVAIAPTFIDTPLVRPFFNDPTFRKWVLDRIPLGRLGTVEEVAAAVVFLASPAASLVTGSSLLVDGGWTAW